MPTDAQQISAASDSNSTSIFTQKIGSTQKIFIILAKTALSTYGAVTSAPRRHIVILRQGIARAVRGNNLQQTRRRT
jgi:hypothetical protein